MSEREFAAALSNALRIAISGFSAAREGDVVVTAYWRAMMSDAHA
jgi:hypothetical protein